MRSRYENSSVILDMFGSDGYSTFCAKVWGCDSNSAVTYHSYAAIDTDLICCGRDVRPLHESRFSVYKNHSVSVSYLLH